MPETTTEVSTASSRTKVRSLAWRGLLLQGGFNYERFQNMGFWWIMRPTLDRLYPDANDRADAYRRHLVYFNTNPWVVGPIAGVAAAMEEQRAGRKDGLDDEAINSVKVGLMAPLAGIGDSLVYGTVRPILAAVCAAMAISGNVAGPILFFVALLVIQILMRWWGTSMGYVSGVKFLDSIGPAQLDRVKRGATMVGLAVTGALVATLLKIGTPWTYVNGDKEIALQDQIDSIMPALIPLGFTLVIYMLIRRRVSPVWVLLGTLIVGLVLGYVGVLG